MSQTEKLGVTKKNPEDAGYHISIVGHILFIKPEWVYLFKMLF